jgi:cytochrome c nitrite reductase small subunit
LVDFCVVLAIISVMSVARRVFFRFALIASVVGALAGGVGGVGVYTFTYAEGASYLTDDPAACMNCHVMREQYDSWQKSSHHAVAVCNDCHAPHDFFGKYTTKGINGFNHSLKFTTGNFHEPIQVTERNRRITENACRDCHGMIVDAIDAHASSHGAEYDDRESISCIRCHRNAGHMH